VGFDACVEEEGEKRKTSRRLYMDELTNRRIKATFGEI